MTVVAVTYYDGFEDNDDDFIGRALRMNMTISCLKIVRSRAHFNLFGPTWYR